MPSINQCHRTLQYSACETSSLNLNRQQTGEQGTGACPLLCWRLLGLPGLRGAIGTKKKSKSKKEQEQSLRTPVEPGYWCPPRF